MTITTKSAVAAAVLGAFWLGVWSAPLVHNNDTTVAKADIELAPAAASSKPSVARTPVLAASDASVRDHVKPLLRSGTNTEKAAEGFKNAEQFMTVAHAAKNTDVPFMLLKHRVLTEKQSLAQAIRASRPELNASLEADRASLEARANLSRFGI